MTVTQKVIAHASDGLPVTLGGSGSALVCWGLHVSDIAVIVSALAAVIGVVLQFYVAMRRLKILEGEVKRTSQKADGAALVSAAVAKSQRETVNRVADVESKLDT